MRAALAAALARQRQHGRERDPERRRPRPIDGDRARVEPEEEEQPEGQHGEERGEVGPLPDGEARLEQRHRARQQDQRVGAGELRRGEVRRVAAAGALGRRAPRCRPGGPRPPARAATRRPRPRWFPMRSSSKIARAESAVPTATAPVRPSTLRLAIHRSSATARRATQPDPGALEHARELRGRLLRARRARGRARAPSGAGLRGARVDVGDQAAELAHAPRVVAQRGRELAPRGTPASTRRTRRSRRRRSATGGSSRCASRPPCGSAGRDRASSGS